MGRKKILVWETLSMVSGGQKMTLMVMDMLSDQYDFCCLIPGEGMLARELKKRSIPYILMGDQTLPTGIKGKQVFFRYGWMSIKNIFKSLGIIFKYKPDILYCPGPAALPWSAICGSILHKIVIWHLHHIFLDEATKKLLNICGKWSSVKKIIAVSQCVGDQIVNDKAHNKVEVLYNPVDVEKYASGNPDKIIDELQSTLHRIIIREKVLILTHIGTITKNKCQEMFVRTILEIKKRGMDVIALMIGDVVTDADRDYRQKINSYIHANGLEKNIYAPGFRRDIADILSATDCVIVPSREGMPLTVLEAMSAKTHVIGMDQGGSKEVLTKAGCGELFTADGTEKDIADAVIRVMKQDHGFIEKGYHFCQQQSTANYSAKIHKLFSVE
jgi:glycosyltransferase involved in cell wall biosynthesis